MKLLAHLTNAIVSTVIVSGALVVLSASVVSAEGRKIPVSPSTAKAHLQEAYGKLPLSFEANRGQADPQVRFLSRATGHTLFLAPTEAVLMLRSRERVNRYSLNVKRAPHDATTQPPDDSTARRPNDSATQRPNESTIEPHNDSTVLRMSFVGANPKTRMEGQEGLPGKANYFLGNDPKKWRTHVPTYAKVHYQDLYPGIDLIYYGNQRQLEHDFVVRPGADPGSIALSFQGADKVEVDAQGDLVLHTAAGAIRQRKPVIYQEVAGLRRDIAGGYLLREKRTVGFKVDKYDPSRPLIIDPVLIYSTYLGGSSSDVAGGIAVDAAGNAYVTGGILSTDFPTTAGAFQTTLGGDLDAFVTKLNPTGSALVYSTFLGGSAFDEGLGIAVGAAGNAYVTGDTRSTNFPITAGAFQTTLGGSAGAFVTKLNPAGSALVYSTYLGGSNNDDGKGIAVDLTGNAYVTGDTDSSNFPTTAGAFQTTLGGDGGDAFVTKLNPAGSALIYSTYLGGSGLDRGLGVAVDASGNAYVTGDTRSTNFPTTAGAFQTTLDGFADAFVTKLNPTGSALIYSTYLGGISFDEGLGIAVDSSGNAYVTGDTTSADFPTTTGAFQASAGGALDVFVAKFAEIGPSATLTLQPPAATNPVNTQHCVTATVEDAGGSPTLGMTVRFAVTGSVTTGGAAATNGSGQATFCYTGPQIPGADTIAAYADMNNNAAQDPSEPTGTATKTWVGGGSSPGAQLQDLIHLVDQMNLTKSLQNRLIHDLDKTLKDLSNTKKPGKACKDFDKIIKDVQNKKGQQDLTADEAADLLNRINQIQTSLGC